jgi:hypothetical protein
VALVILGPFLLAAWAVYAAALVLCVIGGAAVRGIEALWRRAEARQARRHAGTARPRRPTPR